VEVYPVDTRAGVRAGYLLGRVGAGSELAVDAFVVAVADLEGGAIIADRPKFGGSPHYRPRP
jgi:hypothetical protein